MDLVVGCQELNVPARQTESAVGWMKVNCTETNWASALGALSWLWLCFMVGTSSGCGTLGLAASIVSHCHDALDALTTAMGCNPTHVANGMTAKEFPSEVRNSLVAPDPDEP